MNFLVGERGFLLEDSASVDEGGKIFPRNYM